MKPIPVASAFLVCDSFVQDAATGKFTLVGIFNTISAPMFPTTHHSLSLFVSLTDAEGDYEVRIDLVKVKDNLVIARVPPPGESLRLTSQNRLAYHEFVVTLHGLQFSEPGEYEFRLFVDGRAVALRRIWVQQMPPSQQEVKPS
jgi:hypothetical protein